MAARPAPTSERAASTTDEPLIVDVPLRTGPAKLTLPAAMCDADWLMLFLVLPSVRKSVRDIAARRRPSLVTARTIPRRS